MNRQSGFATVEFAAISAAFFMILFGAMEISRLLFTWNALDAITQRGARVAAVCPPNTAAITRVALFDNIEGGGGLLPDFTDENLQISYLDEQFKDTGGAFPIHFVRARIINYQHQMAIPFVAETMVPSPEFSTTMPAESLGYIPETGERSCFGV